MIVNSIDIIGYLFSKHDPEALDISYLANKTIKLVPKNLFIKEEITYLRHAIILHKANPNSWHNVSTNSGHYQSVTPFHFS